MFESLGWRTNQTKQGQKEEWHRKVAAGAKTTRRLTTFCPTIPSDGGPDMARRRTRRRRQGRPERTPCGEEATPRQDRRRRHGTCAGTCTIVVATQPLAAFPLPDIPPAPSAWPPPTYAAPPRAAAAAHRAADTPAFEQPNDRADPASIVVPLGPAFVVALGSFDRSDRKPRDAKREPKRIALGKPEHEPKHLAVSIADRRAQCEPKCQTIAIAEHVAHRKPERKPNAQPDVVQ